MSAEGLYWTGLAVGLIGVAVYFGVLAMRPRWVRVLNGSGLFFSGLGLIQTAVMIRGTTFGAGWFNANAAVVALSVAVLVQCYAVLRNRRAWDGVDRRGDLPGT
jgi:hypothetical protein